MRDGTDSKECVEDGEGEDGSVAVVLGRVREDGLGLEAR